ncbi:MAG: HEAT repeat domain-containing protein [Planctomycetaceae bacterium]|nr:HEAT repeat domain-containing protein [Planctomycetaceae bacterium]GIK52418.1 MAG: hypothetical protein BroJett014_13910 [Planctomycetota bacterium]
MKPVILMITLVVLCLAAGSAYLVWGMPPARPNTNRQAAANSGEDQAARNEELRREEQRLKEENRKLAEALGEASGEDTADPVDSQPKAEPPPEVVISSLDQAKKAFQGEDAQAARKALEFLLRAAKGGDAEVRAFLVQMLGHADERVRALAVEGIGNYFDPKDLPLLEIASRDGSPLVREAAATWISEYPPQYAANSLLGMLNDDNPRVLQRAIEGLGELRDEAAVNALNRMTRHENDDVAAEAAVALRNFGDYGPAERMAPKWVERAREGTREERVHAIRKLGALRVEGSKPALEEMLQDPDPKVVKEARKAIRKIDTDVEKRNAGKPK